MTDKTPCFPGLSLTYQLLVFQQSGFFGLIHSTVYKNGIVF